jgi:hypothetical protein
MKGTFSRSFQLFKESLAVLSHDKELLIFPIISGIFLLLIITSFTIAWLFYGITSGSQSDIANIKVYVLGLFGFYLITYFVIYFFNSAVITCAKIRFSGGNPTVSDGFRNAFRHLLKIFLWSLISAIFSTILKILEFGFKNVGRVLASIFGLTWTLLTFFVLPVIVLEGVNIKDVFKRSADIFKQTWKENVVLQFSVSPVIFLVAFLGTFLIMVILGISGILQTLSVPYAVLIFIGTIVLYWSLLAVIGSALNVIMLTALYIYGATGIVPQAFDPELVKNIFAQREIRSQVAGTAAQ